VVSDIFEPSRKCESGVKMKNSEPTLTHSIVSKSEGYETRAIKTGIYEISPYDTTLLLDVDTFINRPLDDLFLHADNADLAMVLEPHKTIEAGIDDGYRYGYITQAEAEVTLAACGRAFPYFNSGVLLFRRNRGVEDFFHAWRQEWCRFRQRDQFALSRALVGTSLCIKVLPSAFNFFALPHLPTEILRQQSILHFWYGEKLPRWLNYERVWLDSEILPQRK
jgi:lipopolysaccharide biosynthesis glycosyltransferase